MERKQAIDLIARAGKSTEAIEGVSALQAEVERRYNAIRNDGTRSEEYKRAEMAKVFVAAQQKISDFLLGMAEKEAGRDRADISRVFGTEGLDGDPATLAISRRDAADRVAKLETQEERLALLNRATRSGDEVLARAVAEHATEIGDAQTMNAFLADRPRLEQAATRVWQAQQRGENDSMMLSFQTMAGTPQELSGLDRYSIEQLAQTQVV